MPPTLFGSALAGSHRIRSRASYLTSVRRPENTARAASRPSKRQKHVVDGEINIIVVRVCRLRGRTADDHPLTIRPAWQGAAPPLTCRAIPHIHFIPGVICVPPAPEHQVAVTSSPRRTNSRRERWLQASHTGLALHQRRSATHPKKNSCWP